jgi:DnaJ-class molecular chaperone
MTFYEGQEVECDYCDGAGRITDEDYESWEWCPVCDGTGKTEAEPEDYEPQDE